MEQRRSSLRLQYLGCFSEVQVLVQKDLPQEKGSQFMKIRSGEGGWLVAGATGLFTTIQIATGHRDSHTHTQSHIGTLLNSKEHTPKTHLSSTKLSCKPTSSTSPTVVL